VVAAEKFGHGRDLSSGGGLEARLLLGASQPTSTLPTFVQGLPAESRGVFADVARDTDVWRAEVAWAQALGHRAAREARRASTGRAVVAWSAVLLLLDARQACAALEAVQWGPAGLESFDAMA
jgi:hypothetical protein